MLRISGLPQYIEELIKKLPDEWVSRCDRIAQQMPPSRLLIVVGRRTATKDAFAAVTADTLRIKLNMGLRVHYQYAPAIETIKVGDDDTWGHIVIFTGMDEVPKNRITVVMGRIHTLIDNNNFAILLTTSLEDLFSVYGREWLRKLSPITLVTNLQDDDKLELTEVV